jgi:AraC-like DNA-binding protein
MADLIFGWRTALLTLAGVQLLALAVALASAPRNPAANRTLAALLVVLVGLLTPYALGFAGFYDAFPWLSFAPFGLPLAVGPLAYGYAHATVLGRLPRRFGLHLAPAAIHIAYLAVCFTRPLAWKNAWDDAVQAPFVSPAIDVLAIGGFTAYAVAALGLIRRYRAALRQQRSDDLRYAATWVTGALAAFGAWLALWIGFTAWEWAFGSLGYFRQLSLYLMLAAIGLYLGVEGWRHSGMVFPTLEALAPPPAETRRDWRADGERWAAQVAEHEWWRDPELSLKGLAARLATNTHHLSRALNEGLGVNFSEFVNGFRAEAVAEAISQGRREDLLDLAFEAGFSSKASFNRAFRARFHTSPGAYRRHASESKSLRGAPDLTRTEG